MTWANLLPRRGLLTSVLAGAGAVAATVMWGSRPRAAHGRGYQEVAWWRVSGGEGRFIAVGPDPTGDELRALGEHLREEFRRLENAVVMVFDQPEAARLVRQGSKTIGEEPFKTAIHHQRAMYVKQPARNEHRLVIYDSYPRIREEIRY